VDWRWRGPNNLCVQLITTPRVLEGRRRLPTALAFVERICVIATCVIAMLRRHGHHCAVRTIGAIICRSPPISVIIVAVVLSIASSYASNERTNHQCQCCDIFKNHTHDGSFSLAHSSSVKPKQSPTFYSLKQLNNICSQIDNFRPLSPAWYCVTPAGVRLGPIADILVGPRSNLKACLTASGSSCLNARILSWPASHAGHFL